MLAVRRQQRQEGHWQNKRVAWSMSQTTSGSATGALDEDVHRNAADRGVESNGQRHARKPQVAVEAAAPRAGDGRQRSGTTNAASTICGTRGPK
jgi:hypothetical protein